MLDSQARAKGLALALHWQATGPSQRVGDPTRLRQVLLNLLGNAVKFTRAGSVSLVIGGGGAQPAVRPRADGLPDAPDGRL